MCQTPAFAYAHDTFYSNTEILIRHQPLQESVLSEIFKNTSQNISSSLQSLISML